MNGSLSRTGSGWLTADDVWPEMAMVWVFSAAGIAALWLA